MNIPWSGGSLAWRALLALALTEFLRNALFFGVLPLMGSSKTAIGLLVSSHYLADGLAKAPLAAFTERLGLGRMLCLAGLAGLLCVMFLPQLPLSLGIALAGLWGLGLCSLQSGVMTLVSSLAKTGQENRALNWATLAISPSLVLGGVGMLFFAPKFPVLAHDILIGVQLLALLVSFSLIKMIATPKTLPKLNWLELKPIFLLFPAAFGQTLVPGMIAPLLQSLLLERKIGPLELLGLAGAAGLGALLSLTQASRWKGSPKVILQSGLSGLIVGLPLLGWLAGPHWWLYPLGLLVGTGYGLYLSGWNGLLVKTLPPQRRATAWGALMTVEALGFSSGAGLGGVTSEHFGSAAPFYLAAILLLMVQLYYGIPRRSSQSSQSQSVDAGGS